MSPLRHARSWIRTVVDQPLSELSLWQRRARTLADLGRFGWKHLSEDNAPQMAAALSFRTLFGLLPVLVVAMVTAKAFLGERLPGIITWIIEAIGADDVRLPAKEQAGEAMSAAAAAAGERSVELGRWLEQLANEAGRMNLAALGWVGGAIVVYSAISLMVTIENSFNAICRAPSGRNWLKRVPMYWFVLTVGPIVIGFTPLLDVRISSIIESISQWQAMAAMSLEGTGFETVGTIMVTMWQWAASVGQLVWSVCLLWLFMFALYMLVPSTGVGARAALIGSLVAAILLEIGRQFLGAYLQKAFTVNLLYGSLGLLPVFMLWLYMMWMVVLFGMEVAALVHTVGARGLDTIRASQMERTLQRSGLVDPATILVVMEDIAAAFRRGEVSTVSEVAERTGLEPSAVHRMVDRLVQKGFLHHVAAPREGLVLAQPAEHLQAEALIQVGFELTETMVERDGIVQRLRQVQRDFARGRSLEALLGSASSPPAMAAVGGAVDDARRAEPTTGQG